MNTSAKQLIASNLAAALLAGPWTLESMTRRASRACGVRPRWLRPLVRRARIAFGENGAARQPAALTEFLLADAEFDKTLSYSDESFPLRQFFWAKEGMAPAAGVPASWDVPALTSAPELAEWLGVDVPQLDWLADCQGRTHRAGIGPLHHYTYQWLLGRRRKARLLEIPKACLKAIQRRLLHDLLDRIPPHDAAHGYRRGRSIATYVAPHPGQRIVLHFDLHSFFPSIRASRIHALFQTAGYPRTVARLLTGLCTHAVPEEILRTRPTQAEPWHRAKNRDSCHGISRKERRRHPLWPTSALTVSIAGWRR